MNFVTGASELLFSHGVGIFMANPICYRQAISIASLYPEFDTNWTALIVLLRRSRFPAILNFLLLLAIYFCLQILLNNSLVLISQMIIYGKNGIG